MDMNNFATIKDARISEFKMDKVTLTIVLQNVKPKTIRNSLSRNSKKLFKGSRQMTGAYLEE